MPKRVNRGHMLILPTQPVHTGVEESFAPVPFDDLLVFWPKEPEGSTRTGVSVRAEAKTFHTHTERLFSL